MNSNSTFSQSKRLTGQKRTKRQIQGLSVGRSPAPVCTVYKPHPPMIARGREMAEEIQGLEGFFKAFGDASRLKILFALYDTEELCVCDLAEIAGISLASASHHLRFLYKERLLRYEKRGKFVYYALDDDHVQMILDQALVHWRHREQKNEENI